MVGSLPEEYVDYLLIQDLYHCTPEELDRQDDSIVSMHLAFRRIQSNESEIAQKRAEQRSKNL